MGKEDQAKIVLNKIAKLNKRDYSLNENIEIQACLMIEQ